jgi:hypothetical protein
MNKIKQLFTSSRAKHARDSHEWIRRMESPSVRRRFSGT